MLRFHVSNCLRLREIRSLRFHHFLRHSWVSTSSTVSVPIGITKKFHKEFLTRSENEEDITTFYVNPRIMILSVDDPAAAAAFSAELSENFDISSRSRVPGEEAKLLPFSRSVD